MRRNDREVTEFGQIADILRRTDTLRLGLHDEPYPYIVPLSFGIDAEDGKITLYFHGAKEGLKHKLIAANPRVCVEADIFHRYVGLPGSATCEYESVVGFGVAALIDGPEAEYGLDRLMTHCGFSTAWDRKLLDITAVYKIQLTSFTGKRRFVKKD